jgi:isoaspartyl peptidase/L-asparaginase-like protein (Ntn-hydrolase superfamily)
MRFAFAVHGGAGAVRPGEAGEQGMRQALAACLDEAERGLAAGGTALDAVEAAVRRLEAHALFNAGRGSVLNSAGAVEMDAAVMDGRFLAAGAVAGVRRLAHPVSAARAVMEKSRHVLLVAEGAETFALEHGLEPTDPASLITAERRDQLDRARRQPAGDPGGGTVGAVALDARGHLAAATSTGGLVNKLPGRISDSALIGAGTWANDATCAVSATGHGEAIIRVALAHEIDAGMRLSGLSLEAACDRALAQVTALGSRIGLIALDRGGRLALPFTTAGMYRGAVRDGEPPFVAVFKSG